MTVTFGIDRLLADPALRKPLEGRRVALLAHPASVTDDLTHSIDALVAAGVNVTAVFGPQHGVRGDLQDNMMESPDYTDPSYGMPVFSLYGDVRRPTGQSMHTFDIVLIDPDGRILMIQRDKPPYAGHDALPGGFVDPGEDPRTAARRERAEETGVGIPEDDVVFVMNSVDGSRDPRGPIRTTLYAARVGAALLDRAVGADDAREARPVHARDLAGRPLAFDHRNLLAHALGMEGMRDRVNWRDADRLLAGVAADTARNWAFADDVRAARAGRIAAQLAEHGIDVSVNGSHVICRRQDRSGGPVRQMRWDTVMSGPAGRPVIFYTDGTKTGERPAPGPDDVAGQLARLFTGNTPRR